MRISQLLKGTSRKAEVTVSSGGKRWRIFKGSETSQVDGISGKPAKSNLFYFEPANYSGDVLWSGGFRSQQAAQDMLNSSWEPDADSEE